MISKELVRSLIEEKLTDDMFIVDIQVSTGNAISVQIDSDNGLSIDQCVAFSRQIEHNLDRDAEDFELEVSSPGLTQPFKVLRQYRKNIGREIEVTTNDGDKHTGILKEAGDNGILVEESRRERVEGKKKKVTVTEDLSFSFDQIRTAKSVISFK
jgi:ribosome maturation factor RimP